ncbi:hypothetical protein RHSIM_Rhsim01G0251400 [Rhododendron simsii]|uniref:EF-hand domain-containing protein n=1 Tax=Rhododendron simsii TaxID=118357 RepID=A0A834HJW6_RHOSS|nr:hypothetical protein RHSIM_Rhsim01G0251400 [Rhododendron simsii]
MATARSTSRSSSTSCMKALGSESSMDDNMKKMMDEIDMDRDRFISLNKFTDFWGKGSVCCATTKLKEAFEMYDEDETDSSKINNHHHHHNPRQPIVKNMKFA